MHRRKINKAAARDKFQISREDREGGKVSEDEKKIFLRL